MRTCRGCGGHLCYCCGVCQTRLCRCEEIERDKAYEARLANAQRNVQPGNVPVNFAGMMGAINNQLNPDPWIVDREAWGLPRNVNGVVPVAVARGLEIPERRAEPWDDGLEIFAEVADDDDDDNDEPNDGPPCRHGAHCEGCCDRCADEDYGD